MGEGKKRRPGGEAPPKPAKKVKLSKKKPSKQAAKQQKQQQVAPAGGRGDDDDFAYMLDGEIEMPASDNEGGVAAGAAAKGDGTQEGDEGAAIGGNGDAKKRKQRRKRGAKLSALEFEASRAMAEGIAGCSAEEQADYMWASLARHAGASPLERGGLTAAGMAPLPGGQGAPLEAGLKALEPSWPAEFCDQHFGSSSGGGRGEPRPAGSPSLLLISPAATGAVNLIKQCPGINRACQVVKLFARHFKIEVQEAVLRGPTPCCAAAGTPNRLCKLADGGALQLGSLKWVVLDMHLDAKQRSLLDIPETRTDWWQLYERHLREPLAAGQLKLVLVNSDSTPSAAGGGKSRGA